MKIIRVFSLLCLIFSSFNVKLISQQCYSQDLVEISGVTFKQEKYYVITMLREGERIKAKYFAAQDFNGNNVYSRYLEWKKYNPNVVLFSSGTYMDDRGNPQGLTIDNGTIVNQTLIYNKMDALVVVYASGGIAVSNLKDGDLRININGTNRILDIRKNPNDLDDFIEWAASQRATVFQTHLLVYKNQLKIDSYTSKKDERERRFLAVGKNEDGKVVHSIVHCPQYSSLYEGSKKVLDFLSTAKHLDITFMINLDNGAQDVFELYNSNCTLNGSIKGQLDPRRAVNLLTYYFK